MTAQAPAPTDDRRTDGDIIEIAREQVLERGVPLNREQLIEVLRTGDDRLEELLSLAHEVRMRYQGPAIEVEGSVLAGDEVAAWLEANAGKYGWENPDWAKSSKYEPWHWEYVEGSR